MLTYQTGCELQEMLGFCFFLFAPPTDWETGYYPHYLDTRRIPPKNIGGKWKRLTKTLESKCMQQQIVNRASYSQIRNTLFGHCSIIVFKIHVGLLLRWLQGCVRMLHCQFSPLEAFKDVFGIYVEHNNLEKKNIVGRIIPTTGNLTPAFFTVTLISVLAHPKKVMLQGLSWRVLCKTQMHHQSLCLPCQSDEHNCTINNFRQLWKITLVTDPAHPLHTCNKRTHKEGEDRKLVSLFIQISFN